MRNSTRGGRAALAIASILALYSPVTLSHAADPAAQAVAGGWNPIALSDEVVVKAARFAMLEQSRQSQLAVRLLAIKHAREQVVAGTNYSMNLMVQIEGKKRLVIAVVWAKPDGSMELTRWHWV